MRWCTRWSVCHGANLYPFLCLLKRGVCGRVGHRVMLMRWSNVCSRTCHRTEGSASHLLTPVEVLNGSGALRKSTADSWEPRRSARSRMGGWQRLPGVAPVWSLSADSGKLGQVSKAASGVMRGNKSIVNSFISRNTTFIGHWGKKSKRRIGNIND